MRSARAGRPEATILRVPSGDRAGDAPLTRQGVTGIYRRVALAAPTAGLVELAARELAAAVAALSTRSLRVGLTQDLFAASEDGAGIAQTLGWSSPSTALR